MGGTSLCDSLLHGKGECALEVKLSSADLELTKRERESHSSGRGSPLPSHDQRPGTPTTEGRPPASRKRAKGQQGRGRVRRQRVTRVYTQRCPTARGTCPAVEGTALESTNTKCRGRGCGGAQGQDSCLGKRIKRTSPSQACHGKIQGGTARPPESPGQ